MSSKMTKSLKTILLLLLGLGVVAGCTAAAAALLLNPSYIQSKPVSSKETRSTVRSNPTPTSTPFVDDTPALRQPKTAGKKSAPQLITPPASSQVMGNSTITEAEALQLVQRWLSAKPQILAAPYDLDLLDQLATGTVYLDTQEASQWRKANQNPWNSTLDQMGDIQGFTASQVTAWLRVGISSPEINIVPGQDNRRTQYYQFTIVRAGTGWKIAEIAALQPQ
jgi:hypothetical protein